MQAKKELQKELGELLHDMVLEDTSNQLSAVKGKKWKGLGWSEGSQKYKEYKSKIAPGIANLELHGDMLDAMEVKPYRDGIELGVYGEEEALKAENHNKFTKRALNTALPERQFIPRKGQTFRPGIIKELKTLANEILEKYEE